MNRPLFSLPITLSDPNASLPIGDWSKVIPGLPGLVGWYPANSVTVDGTGLVSRLADMGTSNTGFDQANDALQPTLVPDAIEGRPALAFDSARTDVMEFDGAFPLGDHTKVIILRMDGAAAATQHILAGSATADGLHSLLRLNGTAKLRQAIDIAPDAVVATTDFVQDAWGAVFASFDSSAGTGKIRIGSGAITSSVRPDAAVAIDALFLGGAAANAGTFNGLVADILIFDTDLLDDAQAATRATVQRYIEEVYGLPAGAGLVEA